MTNHIVSMIIQENLDSIHNTRATSGHNKLECNQIIFNSNFKMNTTFDA